MGIYGNMITYKSTDLLFKHLDQIVYEHFNFNNIITEAEIQIIQESKFTDIIKRIFNKIKEGIKLAIKKIKDICLSFIKSLKNNNLDEEVKDFKKEDNKRKDIKFITKKEAESVVKEKETKNVSNDEVKSEPKLIESKPEKKKSFALMVIPDNKKFISDRVFENYIDFDVLFGYLQPVGTSNVIRAYMSVFKLSYYSGNKTTAGDESNALLFRKNSINFYDDDFDDISVNELRSGLEGYIKRIDNTIETMFPGIIHVNHRWFKNKETNLETYKKELLERTSTKISYKNITSKDIYDDKDKYLYDSLLTKNTKWFTEVLGNHISFLTEIENQVNNTQQIIEKMISEDIEYKYVSSSGRKYNIDIESYNKYLQKLGKFCSDVIGGIQFLIQTQIKCVKMEIAQKTKLISFYNDCFV